MKRSLISNGLLVVAIVLLALNLIVPFIQATRSSYAAGKIQYKVFVITDAATLQQLEAELNKYGAEGWEFITNVGGHYIFKK